jgi:phage terminase large subunit GpA-like protein
MNAQFQNSLLSLVALGLAAVLEPQPPIAPSAWAAEHLVLPDGEFAGQKIDLSRTPHIVEPIDMLGPDSPANEVGVMKSVQSAFTTMLLAVIGHRIDREPCDMLVVQPTDSALNAFNSTKLNRMLEATEVLGGKPAAGGARTGGRIHPQTSRSGAGSTTYEKKYPGGALNLALASSPADLRLKTVKVALCDEIDEYDDDLAGQGDPLKLIAGRQEMFLSIGTWKRAYVSTPTIKGVSKIEKIYEAGDKRRWHVECSHCRERFVFEWHDPFDPATRGLKFNKTYPYQAHYVTPCCGSIIEGWQKEAVYRSGRWVPTAPGPGKYPSYHFDALASPFVPWDAIAKEFVEAGDDPAKLKPFYNLKLGLPYDVAGDAPDHDLLFQRREDYGAGFIPAGALLLTAGADVQMRGIYVEVVAWAPDQQSWTVFADYLGGETTDVDAGAFAELTKLYLREWPDAFGNQHRIDEFLIDSGYRTDIVYEWTRRHPGTKATKGVDGWGRVPLGTATDQDVDYRGRKMRGGAKVRLMGTWPLKSKFYTYAALMPIVRGSALLYPPGYCHFGRFLDENYFRQITSEYLQDEVFRGRVRKVWKIRTSRDNHFLDCRIGNLAGAHAYFTSFTADDWANRAKERGIPADLQTPDLFTPRAFHSSASPETSATPAGGEQEDGVKPPAGDHPSPAPPRERRVIRSTFMD